MSAVSPTRAADERASTPLMMVRDLSVRFPIVAHRKRSEVHAVREVSFDLLRGESLGLVGESGCGKSTLGRAILQLVRPSSGSVLFDGEDLVKKWRRGLRGEVWSKDLVRLRRRMQMIFQDPYASLNPRMTVEDIIAEPLRNFDLARGDELRERVQDLLREVGMDPRYVRRYPHEFSGGQRQRIGIARALALKPDLIVCDEPISALDVSIQAQVLNLLRTLQHEHRLTYLFIAHDLAAVRHLCDRIAVMYLGRIVELSGHEPLYAAPKHPYTQALLSAVPVPDPSVRKTRVVLSGEVPSASAPPSGCAFHPRCPLATARCRVETPLLREIHAGHHVACHAS